MQKSGPQSRGIKTPDVSNYLKNLTFKVFELKKYLNLYILIFRVSKKIRGRACPDRSK